MTIDAVVLIFAGDDERKDFLLAQFGKAFHGVASTAHNPYIRADFG
jgi:hypothetical protein